MKGVVLKSVRGLAEVVDDLEVPVPGEGQVLVKSLYAALNPVEAYMADTGLLVVDWPLVLGCDAAGIVVKVGDKAEGPLGPLKVGDEVFGCTRLGSKGYSTCQEYFLMDGKLLIPKLSNLTTVEAGTAGVGLYTACLGVFPGFGLPIPSDPKVLPSPTGEWAIVLGGSSSVGKFALQLLKALGYKVLVTCSERMSAALKALGADVTVDYKLPAEQQVNNITSSVAEGGVKGVHDAVAANHDFAAALLKALPDASNVYFTTTDDWTPLSSADFNGAHVSPVLLGELGRPEATKLNPTIEQLVPVMHHLLASGAVKPSVYEVVAEGFDAVKSAWDYQKSGKAGSKKVLVKLQEP